ncbi:hypothetical protein D3C80_2036350 [compost metagenome]
MQDRGDELVAGAGAHAQHAFLPRQVAQHGADLGVVREAVTVIRRRGGGDSVGIGSGAGPGGFVLIHGFTQRLV